LLSNYLNRAGGMWMLSSKGRTGRPISGLGLRRTNRCLAGWNCGRGSRGPPLPSCFSAFIRSWFGGEFRSNGPPAPDRRCPGGDAAHSPVLLLLGPSAEPNEAEKLFCEMEMKVMSEGARMRLRVEDRKGQRRSRSERNTPSWRREQISQRVDL